MYKTSRILVDFWEAFVSSHNWLMDFLPKPWFVIGDFLVWVGALSLSIQILFVAVMITIGLYFAVQEQKERPVRLLARRLFRGAKTAVLAPPLAVAGIIAGFELTLILLVYSVWVTIAIFVLVFAFYAYPTEWVIRLVS